MADGRNLGTDKMKLIIPELEKRLQIARRTDAIPGVANCAVQRSRARRISDWYKKAYLLSEMERRPTVEEDAHDPSDHADGCGIGGRRRHAAATELNMERRGGAGFFIDKGRHHLRQVPFEPHAKHQKTKPVPAPSAPSRRIPGSWLA